MTNTVGSLTKKQKEIVIGCILGDGYLRLLPGRKDAFLEINHSYKAKDYVDWKYKQLKNIVLSKPKIRKQNKDEDKLAYRFFTQEHPDLTKLWKEFYKDNKKTVPKNFIITPLELAIWYMDDGSKTKKGDLYLNCQSFDILSQKRLLHVLRLLKIKARLNKDKQYYRIRIFKDSRIRFFELIKSYIHPTLSYKVF